MRVRTGDHSSARTHACSPPRPPLIFRCDQTGRASVAGSRAATRRGPRERGTAAMALPDTPAHSLRSVAGPPSRWLVGSVLRCKAWLLPRVTALTRTSERLPRCDGRKAVGRWLKTRVGGRGGWGGGATSHGPEWSAAALSGRRGQPSAVKTVMTEPYTSTVLQSLYQIYFAIPFCLASLLISLPLFSVRAFHSPASIHSPTPLRVGCGGLCSIVEDLAAGRWRSGLASTSLNARVGVDFAAPSVPSSNTSAHVPQLLRRGPEAGAPYRRLP